MRTNGKTRLTSQNDMATVKSSIAQDTLNNTYLPSLSTRRFVASIFLRFLRLGFS